MELAEKVRSIMPRGREIWSLPPDACVYDAIAMMAEKRIGSLLVLEEGRLVGILSERDYARKIILQGRSSKDTAVRDIMTSPVIIVTPDQTVGECMRLLTENRIRHLPVVDRGDVAGLVSMGDLVKHVIDAQQETIGRLNAYISGAYPS